TPSRAASRALHGACGAGVVPCRRSTTPVPPAVGAGSLRGLASCCASAASGPVGGWSRSSPRPWVGVLGRGCDVWASGLVGCGGASGRVRGGGFGAGGWLVAQFPAPLRWVSSAGVSRAPGYGARPVFSGCRAGSVDDGLQVEGVGEGAEGGAGVRGQAGGAE